MLEEQIAAAQAKLAPNISPWEEVQRFKALIGKLEGLLERLDKAHSDAKVMADECLGRSEHARRRKTEAESLIRDPCTLR